MNGYAYTLMIQEEAKREAKQAAHLEKIYLDERRKLGLDSGQCTNTNDKVLKNIIDFISNMSDNMANMNNNMVSMLELIRENSERIEELERKYESLPIQLFCNSEEEANKYNN